MKVTSLVLFLSAGIDAAPAFVEKHTLATTGSGVDFEGEQKTRTGYSCTGAVCKGFCYHTDNWHTQPTWETKCHSTFSCCQSCPECAMEPLGPPPSPSPESPPPSSPPPSPPPPPPPSPPPPSPSSPPTADYWAFEADSNSDILAIKYQGTSTTEVHRLSSSSNYGSFNLQTATALHTIDDPAQYAFAVDSNNDLMALKLYSTGSNSVEVHRMSSSSNYGSFNLQTGTALGECSDPAQWAFAVDSNNDLIAFKLYSTGSNSVEVHRMSSSSNYGSFNLQTGTALSEISDPENWRFEVDSNDDVIVLKLASTGSGTTEVHRLASSSNYASWNLQTATALHEIDDPTQYQFAVDANDDLIALKLYSTGSSTTEVHKMSSSSNYGSFDLQTATALHTI